MLLSLKRDHSQKVLIWGVDLQKETILKGEGPSLSLGEGKISSMVKMKVIKGNCLERKKSYRNQLGKLVIINLSNAYDSGEVFTVFSGGFEKNGSWT